MGQARFGRASVRRAMGMTPFWLGPARGCTAPYPFHDHRTLAEVAEDELEAASVPELPTIRGSYASVVIIDEVEFSPGDAVVDVPAVHGVLSSLPSFAEVRADLGEVVEIKRAIKTDWAQVAKAYASKPKAPAAGCAPRELMPAVSSDPCMRCGISGRKGCAHQGPCEVMPLPDMPKGYLRQGPQHFGMRKMRSLEK